MFDISVEKPGAMQLIKNMVKGVGQGVKQRVYSAYFATPSSPELGVHIGRWKVASL